MKPISEMPKDPLFLSNRAEYISRAKAIFSKNSPDHFNPTAIDPRFYDDLVGTCETSSHEAAKHGFPLSSIEQYATITALVGTMRAMVAEFHRRGGVHKPGEEQLSIEERCECSECSGQDTPKKSDGGTNRIGFDRPPSKN